MILSIELLNTLQCIVGENLAFKIFFCLILGLRFRVACINMPFTI